MVLRDELQEIARSRVKRLRQPPETPSGDAIYTESGVRPPEKTAQRQAFDSSLFGVALSGGGIRSATFALGLLQGMADRNILPYIDILSTVSGGGYIGSWLIAWIKRRGSVQSVQQSLRGNATTLRRDPECPERRRPAPDSAPVPEPYEWVTRDIDPAADHVRPVRLLREYASYLAPKTGLSADTLTILSTWLRNTLLNLLILLTLLGAVLLTPRIATYTLLHLHHCAPYMGGLGALLLWIGCYLIADRNLATFGSDRPRYKTTSQQPTRGDDDPTVVKLILPFILLGAFLNAALLWYSGPAGIHRGYGALAFAAIVAVGIAILWARSTSWSGKRDGAPWPIRLHAFVAVAGSTTLGWLLVYLLYPAIGTLGADTQRGVWLVAAGGAALMLAVISLVVMIFIGLLGKDMSDEQREWWGRMAAWLILTVGGWIAICAICYYTPLWMAQLGLKATAAGIGWATITGWGAKLAYSPKSGINGGAQSSWYNSAVLTLAPAVFLAGILTAVSCGLFWLVDWLVYKWPSLVYGTVAQQMCCKGEPFTLQRVVDYYWTLMYPGSLAPVILIAALSLICLLFAWRVDVNAFSMHNFYKNRLVRCYLGASRARAHRAPNAFTGFDLEDDVRLFRFQCADKSQPGDMRIDCQPSYTGPFPIVNTTLNVTQGQDLGVQERKAESFVFTPLWSGFDYSRRQATVKKTSLSEYGYRETAQFGDPDNCGVFLGTAMAISGAAFNSNAGFHTSPTLAFLLTVFGVRLGWWAGNPRFKDKWTLPSPKIGLLYLTKELTANTGTDSHFVLLSDGGHFENMGLYELIRRRCRYIILSDAEEDEKFKLEGIGGAIRKCRVDFGAVIDLNLEALQPLGDPGVSRLHYSLGTVLYPGEKECGKLVYIKSSVTGDEPVDVIEFRKRHKEFPHTSTADQFFDESHFESYRALGQHIAQGIFTHDMPELPVSAPDEIRSRVAELFSQIETDWQTNLKATKKSKSSDQDNSNT